MPQISGVTKDAAGIPVSAVIDVHRMSNGALVARTVSNPADGSYVVETIDNDLHAVTRHVATVVDTNAIYRVLGMHMSGADGSTSITDVCGHIVTVEGDAKIDAVTTDPYGGQSGVLTLDGSGDRLIIESSPDLDVLVDGIFDFTIRFKFMTTQSTAGATILGREWGSSPYSDGLTIMLRLSEGGPIACWFTGYSSSVPMLTGTTTSHGDGSWHDFEWSCSSASETEGTHRLFVDGQIEGQAISSAVQIAAIKRLCIGDDLTFGGGARAYIGKIKDVEILVGKALHTSNFTPPSQTFYGSPMGTPTSAAQVEYVTPGTPPVIPA